MAQGPPPFEYFKTLAPTGRTVALAITIDYQEQMAWGSWNTGGGWLDTPKTSFSNVFLYVSVKSRHDGGYTGISLDNVLVESANQLGALPPVSLVPEPSNRILLILGIPILVLFARTKFERRSRASTELAQTVSTSVSLIQLAQHTGAQITDA